MTTKKESKVRRFERFFVFMEERDPASMILFIAGIYFLGLFLGWYK